MDKITVPMGLNGCLKYSSVACAAAVLHFFVTFSRLCWWLLTNGSHFYSFAKSEAGSRALIKLNCSAAVRRNPVAKGEGRITASPWSGLFPAPFPPRCSCLQRHSAHRLQMHDWRAFPGDVPGAGCGSAWLQPKVAARADAVKPVYRRGNGLKSKSGGLSGTGELHGPKAVAPLPDSARRNRQTVFWKVGRCLAPAAPLHGGRS